MSGNEHKKAVTRKVMNRAANQEQMRSKISFTKTIDRIMSIEKELLEHARPTKVLQQDGTEIEVQPNPVPAVIAALRTVLDSAYKRLNKVLPDLKPIDANHANELAIESEELGQSMGMIELRAHIRHLLTSGVDEPAEPVEPELPYFLK